MSELVHPRPAWFARAVAAPYESKFVTVDGCEIHYLLWKPQNALNTLVEAKQQPPSVVFLHGSAAHAHWWQHIAPFFVEDGYEALALSFSGFGDSGSREALGR